MNSIDKLSEIFAKFPGIGPRQAKRFVYYILSRNSSFTNEFIRAVESLKKEITQCTECMRYYPSLGSSQTVCSVCADFNRDESMLMIVPRDIDLEAVERSGTYHGYYFVLGGSVPILEKEPARRIRVEELKTAIDKRMKEGLKEVILAMNANAEGENTADFIKEMYHGEQIIFSTLGRGLSTGAELEYADPETLKNAFLHRTR